MHFASIERAFFDRLSESELQTLATVFARLAESPTATSSA